jgi:hypothetical protein
VYLGRRGAVGVPAVLRYPSPRPPSDLISGVIEVDYIVHTPK